MLLGSLLVLLNSCCVASPAKDEVSEMSTSQATLFLLRGKIVAGKSTLANGLATRPTTLLISEDHWNSSLFLGIPDHRSLQLIFRAPAQGHGAACCFLAEGGHVGGARFSGKYFNELHSSTSQTKHASVGSGSRTRPVITPSRQVITSYFVPPTPDEGLKVVVHSGRQKQLTACADFVGKAVTAV